MSNIVDLIVSNALWGGSSGGGLPTGGEPHQMLVTNAEGKAEWQERLAWKEDKTVVIIPETQASPSPDGRTYIVPPLSNQPEVGAEYTVKWNGTEYKCTAGIYAAGSSPAPVAIGKHPALGDAYANVPFFVLFYPEDVAANTGAGANILPMDGATEITISVTGGANEVKQVPEEFIPAQDWAADEGKLGHIKNRTHYGHLTAGDVLYSGTVALKAIDSATAAGDTWYATEYKQTISPVPKAGDWVLITFNEKQYRCECVEESDGYMMIGNMPLFMGTGDSGVPFVFDVATYDSEFHIYTIEPAAEATVTIAKEVISADKQLDPAYIPDNSCYLTSPNGTRYKLTVSDDGTLTATAL